MTRPRLRRLLLYRLLPPAAFLAWLLAVWPPPVWYRTHWPAETAFMAMREGSHARRRYRPVPLDSMAPAVREAATTGEDARFWTHGGIDYQEVRHALGYRRARFAWDSARDRQELRRVLGGTWHRREALRGASTITQQVAKNLYLSPSRNPLRKMKEAVTAWRLERALGKPRILELYLNIAELGDGIWGVEAASRRYFNTIGPAAHRNPGRRRSPPRCRSRSRSNPGYRPNRMRRRQDLILRRMRGERIEVPPVEEEPLLQPGDTIQWTPGHRLAARLAPRAGRDAAAVAESPGIRAAGTAARRFDAARVQRTPEAARPTPLSP